MMMAVAPLQSIVPRIARILFAGSVIGVLITAPSGVVMAQSNDAVPTAPVQKNQSESQRQLDFLMAALKAAPDVESAKHVEARIVAIWMQTPSDTAALLMMRARQAMDTGNVEVALQLFDALVKVRPDYVEAWNKRATLYYMQSDYTRSLADIREVLAREPRHFGALAGLGMIMREIGNERDALAAFRQVLQLHPHLGNIPELVRQLTEKVEGRDI